MSNFAFLPPAFKDLAEASRKAEAQIMGDPRAACFHARFALEAAVRWLYRYDRARLVDGLIADLLDDAGFLENRFRQQVAETRIMDHGPEAGVIRHPQTGVRQYDALQVVKELHHFCYWLTRTYAPQTSLDGATWSDATVPQPVTGGAAVPRKELEALEKQLEVQAKEALKQQQEKDALDTELQMLRAHLAEAKAAAEAKPDTHDYSEAQTRHDLVNLELKRAGWLRDQPRDKEFEVTGMPNPTGKGYVCPATIIIALGDN